MGGKLEERLSKQRRMSVIWWLWEKSQPQKVFFSKIESEQKEREREREREREAEQDGEREREAQSRRRSSLEQKKFAIQKCEPTRSGSRLPVHPDQNRRSRCEGPRIATGSVRTRLGLVRRLAK